MFYMKMIKLARLNCFAFAFSQYFFVGQFEVNIMLLRLGKETSPVCEVMVLKFILCNKNTKQPKPSTSAREEAEEPEMLQQDIRQTIFRVISTTLKKIPSVL